MKFFLELRTDQFSIGLGAVSIVAKYRALSALFTNMIIDSFLTNHGILKNAQFELMAVRNPQKSVQMIIKISMKA